MITQPMNWDTGDIPTISNLKKGQNGRKPNDLSTNMIHPLTKVVISIITFNLNGLSIPIKRMKFVILDKNQ